MREDSPILPITFNWEKIKGSLIRDLCEDLKIRRIKRSEQIFNNLLFKIEKNL